LEYRANEKVFVTIARTPRRRLTGFGNLRKLRARWRQIAGKETEIAADLPDRHVASVVAAIEESLSRREPAARREAASRVVRAYASLNEEGTQRFFRLLANRFGTDRGAIVVAATAFASAVSAEEIARVERELRRAVKPRYAELLHILTGLPDGVKFLVDLRADLLMVPGWDDALGLVDDELAGHLSSLFDVGLLELRRISWETSSAALLERLISYEAVHEISGWDDLKHRLDGDRRCYAFLHPAMPDEPLVFVEVALTKGLAGNLPALLDQSVPPIDPTQADTAIFYSITNCQRGLVGVNLGNELIKIVVRTLQQDIPQLKRFATLSPIGSFREWAEQALAEGELTPAERQAFATTTDQVRRTLQDPSWLRDREAAERVSVGLLSMAARYLTTTVNGRIPDAVANFHLSNGAYIERLNWLANPAPYELARSYGLMVNYCYEPGRIEENAEGYLSDGVVATSNQVQGMVRS